MDWSDEVKARLGKLAYVLYPLSDDVGDTSSADIRAALEEIKRQADLVAVQYRVNESMGVELKEADSRAEAAEAKLAEAQRAAHGTPCNCEAWIEASRTAEDEWRDLAKAEGADEEHERKLVRRAEAAEAAHRDAAVQWQEESRLRREAEAKLAEAQTQINALRLACNVSAADLIEVGRICGQTDDEYPLKAVQRMEAEVERQRERAIRQHGRAEVAEAEVERLRSVPDGMHRPDAAYLRSLPGDQVTEDRYWIGWTDALDSVSAALRGGGE